MQEPKISDNAKVVLEKRYLAKDMDGKVIETPLGMLQRVARAIADGDRAHGATPEQVEETYKSFLEMMVNLEFLPNSPTLMNAGRELGQLSACFVLPVEDSIESIFEAIKHTAMIHKSGGGTGFSFSRLRPKNDIVKSTNGVSSGPVSFLKVFDAATEAIKQGGTRRGANMGILRIDHPDILEFIKCKSEDKTISNFNISVGITEDFMRAVDADEEYPLLNPRGKAVVERLRAKEVFDLIVDMAWKNGEPGIIFLDRLNKDNPTPTLGEIESTNPCGEQPLLPYEACNLGSLNLATVVIDGQIDWDKLAKLIKKSVHFLDNVIDVNRYPLESITKMCRENRKIGLGVMGFADMLFLLGISYNSQEAVDLANKIMAFVQDKGREASRELAETRGPFPNFHISTYAQGDEPPVRNATITTIAPTGTISMIAGVSSGIEPVFAISYVRNIMDGKQFFETNTIFQQELEKRGLVSDELLAQISSEGTIAHIDQLPPDIKRVFVCAHDISPYWHVRMQAAFQMATDNAVSKTVNFPNNATREDVKEVFVLAYKLGCKGVTIYRDGSRSEQVLSIKEVNKEAKAENVETGPIAPRERPEMTKGVTFRIRTGCGNLFVTINHDEKGICEVFATMGKSGGCAAAQSDGIARLISLALRAGVDTKAVIGQIRGLRCPSPTWGQNGAVLSCPDAISQALERVLSWETLDFGGNSEPPKNGHSTSLSGNILGLNPQCPDCGAMLEFAEGCVICKSCGYSKCG
ncbi:MAG TPA: vitamin B12-dependent ribonucleotide reductase [Caldisericia bacterium]|nr:vitamin B12-dependent ribonucleotide reductase [Caldisericia bacterium]HPL88653.1 vitamin B12-dependent ribonucleotide reductase [Caldisericia bacterium]HQG59022.1 vitamin B12-dependent ribonucleotide reductase [Caldisericia bacterium]HQH48740.1 vitamin B12-dependent ribonucleotide reductase [Caldisericia bacterium]HQJ43887.1 vitamin B12-dependent ribonucleotide reductase [Caldisericia bacterium]